MLWIIITTFCGVAIAFRIYTLADRPQVWWIAFTGTLACIAPGAGLLMNEDVVNKTLGTPNLAFLLSNLCFIGAAGSVQVYVHSLRTTTPSRRKMAIHLGTAAAVAAVVILGWIIAPVHSHTYPQLRLAPFTPSALLYVGVFHTYLGAVLANVAVCAATLIRRTPRHDPGRGIGLTLIAVSATLDVVAHVCYLLHLGIASFAGDRAALFATAADLVTLVAMTGIVSGTVTFVIAPTASEALRARRLVSALAPLWSRILELTPDVGLPPTSQRGSAYRAERMIIEITDGLSRLKLPPRQHQDPYVSIAQALLHSPPRLGGASPQSEARLRTAPGVPATVILPQLTDPEEEEVVLTRIARAYTQAKETSRAP